MQPFHLTGKCRRRHLVPVLLLGFLSSKASAQTVKGLVIDKNGTLPGATVRVLGNRAATNTELDGTFNLNADTLGKISLELSYIGHQSRTIAIDLQRGLNDAGTLELDMDKSRLGEVLVKGTMAPSQAKAQSIKKNSLAIMEVISADAIGKLPDRNAAEAVQRVQGVAVARYHGEADQATVRGTPFSWTSTLFNGSRLPSANVMGNRATVLDVIPSEIIQYVQVSKAITPDMEGDAIGGAINFITRTAPEKRTLGVSAAGGYNTFSQNGTYNGSVVYGDRFLKNKLGVIVAAAVWDRQWGADSYELSYNTGLGNPQQQKSINTAMLKRYMGKRQTFGVNAGLEYVFNSANKIYFRGLADRFNDIRPVYESYVDFTNSRYQYNYRYSHYQTVLNGGELGGEHQLGAKLRMDWSYSNYSTRYYLETPPTNPNKGLPIATFRQGITGGFANASQDGKMYWNFDAPDGKGLTEGRLDPVLNNSAEGMDPNKLSLQQLVIAQLNTKEADQVGQLNFRLEPNSRLRLKAGLKFRHKYREGLYGSSFVYVPGANRQSLASLETTNFPVGGGFFHEMPGNYGQYIMNPLTSNQLFDLFDPATLQANGYREVTPATNPTNVYSGTENVMAGYAMAEYDMTTKLKLVGGLRNEYTMMQLNGSRGVTTGTPPVTTIVPTTVESNYNALLPMVHAKFALNDRTNLRAAYTKTFMRPNFVDLSPGEAVNVTGGMTTITKGNPDLKPTFSNNFDLMGEYYFKGLGLVSGGFFYKDISNVIFSNRSFYTEGGSNIMLTQAKNFDRAKLYGFEAGINKRFSFLPGFWSGFGAEFNYTFIQSETRIDRLVLNADKSYTTVSDKLQLPNQSRDLFNAILFYERKGVMVRLAGNYRGASIESVNQLNGPEFYVWTDRNFTIDASATVNVTRSIRAFVELNNLSDEPLRAYMGDRRRITQNEWYGRRGQAGIRWDIIR